MIENAIGLEVGALAGWIVEDLIDRHWQLQRIERDEPDARLQRVWIDGRGETHVASGVHAETVQLIEQHSVLAGDGVGVSQTIG